MSSTQLFAFGINHQTAPLDVREQVSFPADAMEHALHDLVSHRPVREAAIVSTCNRTEIYCSTDKPDEATHWLADFHRLPTRELEPYLYRLPREKAVKHAFRVASGLDSMVLGEPQILGQLKDAVKSAEHAGTLGMLLHKLFQRTFFVAKEVRSSTEIGTNSVSMAAASTRLAERIFGDIAEQRVLFIGAGEMIELCATHFAAVRPRQIAVANRTLERAETLAAQFDARTLKLSALPDHLAEFDVVVSCTASSLPILGLGMVERAARARRHRPMVMVDLAVPRDIEPEVGRLADVYLYTVDDLGRMVQSGTDARRAAVVQAEAIIEARVRHFMHWLSNREIVPAIIDYQQSADALRLAELDRARRQLARGEDPEAVLELLAHSLTHKYMHGPLAALNRSEGAERDQLLALLPRLLPESGARRR